MANADDASLWRWFSYLLEERRIRWRYHFGSWLVSVDCVHVATELTFDRAIRQAKAGAQERGLGLLDTKTLRGNRSAHSAHPSKEHAG